MGPPQLSPDRLNHGSDLRYNRRPRRTLHAREDRDPRRPADGAQPSRRGHAHRVRRPARVLVLHLLGPHPLGVPRRELPSPRPSEGNRPRQRLE